MIPAKAKLPHILSNISLVLASTKARHKCDHVMNIGCESDCDGGHKPFKLIHAVWENATCPMKDIKILFCPGSVLRLSFGTSLPSIRLRGLLSNAFLLMYLLPCHIGGVFIWRLF